MGPHITECALPCADEGPGVHLFWGLLLQLTGDLQKLQELEVDANIYLLMRKV